MGHPVLSLLESRWKLRQQHDQNFPMDGWKAIIEQTLVLEEINQSKRTGLRRVTVRDPSWRVNHLSKII